MRQLRLLLVMLCMTTFAEKAWSTGWVNALKPTGATSALVATKEGKAQCEILVPQNPLPTEAKAAEALQVWLERMTKVKIPIIQESGAASSNAVISVGNTALAEGTDLGPLAKGIEDEGYAIIAKDGNLFLLGGKRRGPLYAAYALLEEDLGCRWYTRKGDDVIPSAKDLLITYVPRQYNPPLTIRFPGLVEAFDSSWLLKNRANPLPGKNHELPAELGGSLTIPAGNRLCHTFLEFMPLDKYFDTHPEYYSEVDGMRISEHTSLCMSNPDVVKIVTQRVKKLFRNSTARYVGLSPDDAHRLCQCPKCKAINDPQGTPMGALMTFLNQVAGNITDEFPDRRILCLAYLSYAKAPKTIKPAPNVSFLLCTDRHDWSFQYHNYNETKRFQSYVKGWNDNGANYIVWMYIVNFGHFLLPQPNMEVTALKMRYLLSQGVKGLYLQGDVCSVGTDSGYMRAWVWAKQLWNPELDTFILMKDFIYGYYGPAADSIWKYQVLKSKLWSENHCKPHICEGENKTTADQNPLFDAGTPDSRLYSPEFVARSVALMDEAIAACHTDTQRHKVEAVKLQVDYLKLCQALGYYKKIESYVPSKKTQIDTRDIRATLDAFEATVRRERVRNKSEVWGIGDIDYLIPKWEVVLYNYGQTNRGPGTITLGLDSVSLASRRWCGNATARLVKDDLSESGYSIYQPCVSKTWSIQWPLQEMSSIEDDVIYILRAKIRLGALKSSTGTVLNYGVHGRWEKSKEVSAFTPGKFTWIELGRIKGSERNTFWMGGDENSAVKAFFVERAELVPVDETVVSLRKRVEK